MLRFEPSMWDTFGVTVTRDGQRVGPELFSVLSDEQVHGSVAALRHVRHARVYQGFVVGFGVIGVGLIGTGAGARAAGTEWTTADKALVAGGILGLLIQATMAAARENELAAAVSAYNADVLRGNLPE